MTNLRVGMRVDNIINGLLAARNCKIVGRHPLDKNLFIVLTEDCELKFLAPAENLFRVNK